MTRDVDDGTAFLTTTTTTTTTATTVRFRWFESASMGCREKRETLDGRVLVARSRE